MVKEMVDSNFATKIDLARTKEQLEFSMAAMESRIVIKLGAMNAMLAGLIIAAIKLL